jgi:hypothetical protein
LYWVSIPGVKRPELGVDHPIASRAEVKERIELYFYSQFGLRGLILGEIYLVFPSVSVEVN